MAIRADATADYLALTSGLPNSGNGGGTSGAVTVMFWFLMETGPSIQRYGVCLGDGSDECWNASVQGQASSPWQLGIYGGGMGGAGGNYFGTASILINTWYCSAFTISAAGAVNTYVDGVADVTGGSSSTSITATSFRVGDSGAGDHPGVGFQFYGLKIWNRELTSGQITTEGTSYSPVSATNLYGSWLLTSIGSTIADDSGNGHTLTRNGSSFSTVSDPPPIGAVTIYGRLGEVPF